MPRFLEVTDKAAARDVVDVYSRAQTVGPGDDLPIESGFWWISEPVAVNGRVFMGTCAEDFGVWLQEWNQPVENGPFWLHRYFLGYYDFVATGETASTPDLRSDHAPATIAVKEGKPLVAFWSGQAANCRINYRVSDQNVEDAYPGKMTFGPLKVHAISDRGGPATYTQLMLDGDDIWMCHRAGSEASYWGWAITKFGEWASEEPTQYDFLVGSLDQDQIYAKGRIVDGVMRCLVSAHPTLSLGNKIWYCEINLTTGAITTAAGAAIGNLFTGANMPLEKEDLEVVFTSTSPSKPWGFDLGYGSTRELVFADGNPSLFNTTGKYKYARYSGGSWSVSDIANVGNMLSSTTGAYWPSINFVPDEPNTVLLNRSEGASAGTHYIEKRTTTNNGASWVVSEVIDSSPVNFSTGIPRRALTRQYPVRVEAGSSPFSVIGTDLREYPNFNRGWVMYVRPLPLSHPVKRVPVEAPPIETGLREIADDPTVGVTLPGRAGSYIYGPTVNIPPEGCRIEVDVALNDWSPATEVALISKEAATDNRELRMVLIGSNTKKIGVYWSEDGTTPISAIFNAPVPAVDGQRIQLAMEFTTDVPKSNEAGALQHRISLFYRYDYLEPWRPLDGVTANPTTSFYNSTSPWEIGSRRLGSMSNAKGNFYRASIYTLDLELLAEWRADKLGAISTDPAGEQWVVASSAAGASTSPELSKIVDQNGSTLLEFTGADPAANNYFRLLNSLNSWVGLRAVGEGTNIPIYVRPKGTASLVVYNTDSTPTIQAIGSDSNSDLILAGQGTGEVLASVNNAVRQVQTRSVVTVNSGTTLGAVSGHRYVVLLAAGAEPTLPTAVGNKATYVIKNISGGNVSVATTSGQTIENQASLTLSNGQAAELVSDNANWWIV